MIDELDTLLKREKFSKYLLSEEQLRFISELINQAFLVNVTIEIFACRDAKDNKFLELAVSGDAHTIISGDQDLLTLHPFQDILIMNPSDFLLSQ